MRKNGFFTFCFAFVPGAGQMYQGYMKRGLSLIGICCAAAAVGSLFTPLVPVAFCICCVVWMYSFFDTFNLRAQLTAGLAPEDDYLVHLGHDVTLDRLLARRHKLLGWGLVAVGVYTLYEELVMDFLRELYWNTDSSWIVRVIYNIMNEVPTAVVCLALIALGVWLVRGPRPKDPPSADPFDQIEEFCEYAAKEEQDDGQEN